MDVERRRGAHRSTRKLTRDLWQHSDTTTLVCHDAETPYPKGRGTSNMGETVRKTLRLVSPLASPFTWIEGLPLSNVGHRVIFFRVHVHMAPEAGNLHI